MRPHNPKGFYSLLREQLDFYLISPYENLLKIVHFATSENLTVKNTMFIHNIQKFARTPPDKEIHNQIYYTLIGKGHIFLVVFLSKFA
jgi:hypothetical protein